MLTRGGKIIEPCNDLTGVITRGGRYLYGSVQSELILNVNRRVRFLSGLSPVRSVRSTEGWRALFLHMGAYWPLHSLRMGAPRRCGATFATIRNVFVKIAVRVEELMRSIKLACPCHLPNADVFALITRRLTAQGP
jgi:hypothetical protein